MFLYIRMIFIMGVTLYTSRIVLVALGVDDFGVYNVVGGLSASFVFFSSALTNATQRFLNFEHGIGNSKKLNDIFNLSLLIYTFIAFVIVIIGVIFGTWFIRSKMTIPASALNAACIVLYATLFSLLFSFIGSVYESVLIARENMKIYAYLGIIDAFGRLSCAFIITLVPTNRLAIYAILLCIIHVLPKLALIIYCKSHYSETINHFYWNKELFKQLFSFAGWNIYGTGVWMLNQQGINILLNIFFGPVVNAARGITSQITSAISNLSVNFFTAVRPQIIKNYAAKQYDDYTQLIYSSSKYSVYLVWLICLPLWLKCDYILTLWLKDVPEYTTLFVKWVVGFILIDTLNNPLWSGIQAVGNLKKTILYGSTYYLLVFPVSYLLLKHGGAPWVVYPILIFFRGTYLIIVFRILASYVPLKGSLYLSQVLLPIILTLCLSFIVGAFLNPFFEDNFLQLSLFVMITIFLNFLTIFCVGLSTLERNILIKKLKKIKNEDNTQI